MTTDKIPSLYDINETYEKIKPFINKTPIITSSTINSITQSDVYFKCENFQKVGAFKFRGAINSVLNLPIETKNKGVCTHSSGNHAQALALAAKLNNIPAFIVMPNNTSKVKVDAVRDYGAEITFCEPTLEAREQTLNKIQSETMSTFIHPYDYFHTICGAGTSALELLEEIPDLDIIITPVGGGGLISGTLIASKGINPKIKVYAAEPLGACDAKKSLEKGEIVPSINPKTICDGLLTSLGKLNFEIIKSNIDDILLVDDYEILNSMKLIWERTKIICEPSCATVLAVVIKYPELFKNKKVGLILSGGNIDINPYFDILRQKIV